MASTLQGACSYNVLKQKDWRTRITYPPHIQPDVNMRLHKYLMLSSYHLNHATTMLLIVWMKLRKPCGHLAVFLRFCVLVLYSTVALLLTPQVQFTGVSTCQWICIQYTPWRPGEFICSQRLLLLAIWSLNLKKPEDPDECTVLSVLENTKETWNFRLIHPFWFLI